jgi:hypothetical protein
VLDVPAPIPGAPARGLSEVVMVSLGAVTAGGRACAVLDDGRVRVTERKGVKWTTVELPPLAGRIVAITLGAGSVTALLGDGSVWRAMHGKDWRRIAAIDMEV